LDHRIPQTDRIFELKFLLVLASCLKASKFPWKEREEDAKKETGLVGLVTELITALGTPKGLGLHFNIQNIQ
jgi:hypothetical protein